MTEKFIYSDLILGEALCAVTFIHDYLQLQFSNGNTFSLFNPVTVNSNFDSSSEGFSDALRSLIGSITTGVTLDDNSLYFDFQNGGSISLSMNKEDYSGPEAFSFRGSNNELVAM